MNNNDEEMPPLTKVIDKTSQNLAILERKYDD